jgi:hypothetical protein
MVHQKSFVPKAKIPIVVGAMVDISGRERVRRTEVGVEAKKSGKGVEVGVSIIGYLPITLEMWVVGLTSG